VRDARRAIREKGRQQRQGALRALEEARAAQEEAEAAAKAGAKKGRK
jgi:hypothetical protein